MITFVLGIFFDYNHNVKRKRSSSYYRQNKNKNQLKTEAEINKKLTEKGNSKSDIKKTQTPKTVVIYSSNSKWT